MRNQASLPWMLVWLVAFALGCGALFVWLLSESEAKLPFMGEDYHFSFVTDQTLNLVSGSEVRMAGVRAGRVDSIENSGQSGARVNVSLAADAAPLREGVQVRVGERSLIGEGTVAIHQGSGRELSSGTRLPAAALQPSVQLDDVLRDLDPNARAALHGVVNDLGDATTGSHENLSKTLAGLGDLGREGHTAIDAIAAQSEDLEELTRQTSVALSALNSGEDNLGRLVTGANRITTATSGQSDKLEQSMRQLPGVVDSGKTAFGRLSGLSNSLAPVAANLKTAAPDLNTALEHLPQTSSDIRGLVPSLNTTLDRAPDTLNKVPQVSGDLRAIVPGLRTTMSNLNPVLRYVKPYGHDLAAFITNFGAIMGHTDKDGVNYLNLQPFVNEQLPTGNPLTLPTLLTGKNPYPLPGALNDVGAGRSFERLYPDGK